MTAQFQMQPSPFHLGRCNALMPADLPDQPPGPCGEPAVERWLSNGAREFFGNDQRRCRTHRPARLQPDQ